MCSFHQAGPAAQRHFKVTGGGVVVHQEYPEHVARACAAIRRRRLREVELNGVRHDV